MKEGSRLASPFFKGMMNMSEKKTIILEGAMELFSKKGFNQTSMQEIADHLGIAKGSIYHYFKSKDQILLEIIWHYYEVISTKMKIIEEDPALTERQKFFEQLRLSLSVFVENREFILVNMKETFQFKTDIEAIFHRMRKEIMHWLELKLLSVYGEKARPYVYDLVVSLKGFAHEYMSLIFLDQIQVDITRLTHHLLTQCDVLVEGYMKNENPLLVKEMFQKNTFPLDEVERIIQQLESNCKENEMVLEILPIFEQEWKKWKVHQTNKSKIILKSLFLHLMNELNEQEKEVNELKRMLDDVL